METIQLNNKIECPVIGIDTYLLTPAEAEVSVREALKMGYSLVDTCTALCQSTDSSGFLTSFRNNFTTNPVSNANR